MPELEPDITDVPPEGSRFASAQHILGGFVVLALIVWLLSGIYQVKAGQVAIVERLGQYVGESQGTVQQVSSGLHYHLPFPIDRVSIISTQQNYTMQINAFNSSPDEYADFKRDLIRRGNDPGVLNALFDPYLITSDKSVLHLELNVQFRIDDPVAWLKSVSHEYAQDYDPARAGDMRNTLFQQIAQREILRQVAHVSLDSVLGEGRADLERNISEAFQDGLEIPDPDDATGKRRISTGVTLQAVTVSFLQVPDAVKPAYDNLVAQMARAKSVQINADAGAAGMVAKAQGETQTLISQAEQYRDSTEQAAQGEADRFKQVYAQYQKAPQISRINLWLDTAQTVYSMAKRIYFVQPHRMTTIIVDPPDFNPNQAKPSP